MSLKLVYWDFEIDVITVGRMMKKFVVSILALVIVYASPLEVLFYVVV